MMYFAKLKPDSKGPDTLRFHSLRDTWKKQNVLRTEDRLVVAGGRPGAWAGARELPGCCRCVVADCGGGYRTTSICQNSKSYAPPPQRVNFTAWKLQRREPDLRGTTCAGIVNKVSSSLVPLTLCPTSRTHSPTSLQLSDSQVTSLSLPAPRPIRNYCLDK